jgi:hypothetical protein
MFKRLNRKLKTHIKCNLYYIIKNLKKNNIEKLFIKRLN